MQVIDVVISKIDLYDSISVALEGNGKKIESSSVKNDQTLKKLDPDRDQVSIRNLEPPPR
jgi:hypothetical protein